MVMEKNFHEGLAGKKNKLKRGLALAVSLILALSFAGCGNSQTSKDGESVSLKYYFPLNAQDDNDMILGEANKMVQEKLGAGINFIAVDFANYSQKMQLINASREVYDLCFTSNWSNDYYQNVENGNLTVLDELLSEYAPGLMEQVGERYWDGVRVDGKIYGVINRQIMAREAGYIVPYAFADEVDMNLSEELKTLDGIETYIKAVQEKHPEAVKVFPLALSYMNAQGLDFFMGDTFPAAVYRGAEGCPKVVNPYESQAYKDYLAARKSWVSQGIAPANMVVDNEALNAQFFLNGQLATPIAMLSTNKPGVEAEMLAQHEVELKAIPIGGAVIGSSSVLATMLGIPQTSKNPETAMKYINLVNTDKELYNLLSFGIEGRNYTKVGENRIELNKEHSYIAANWSIGDVYNSYLIEGQDDDVWEQTEEMNKSAELSPLFGFVPDTSSLSVQISNCTTVVNEFSTALDWGVGDVDAQYNEFVKKLSEAGIGEIITAIQAQIDTWYQQK